jgi:outer membrane protein assembly factor BamE (lipoprotein component of BamABCDE complex)
MKRQLVLITVVLLIVSGLALAGVFLTTCPHCRTVGDRFLYLLFLKDDATTFAPTYNDAAFDSVGIGMTKEQVQQLLGEPLAIENYGGPAHKEIWRYTKAPPDRNFWFRIVVFEGGHVTKLEGKYFVD